MEVESVAYTTMKGVFNKTVQRTKTGDLAAFAEAYDRIWDSYVKHNVTMRLTYRARKAILDEDCSTLHPNTFHTEFDWAQNPKGVLAVSTQQENFNQFQFSLNVYVNYHESPTASGRIFTADIHITPDGKHGLQMTMISMRALFRKVTVEHPDTTEVSHCHRISARYL